MVHWIAVLFLYGTDPIILDKIKYDSEEDCWAHTTELVLDLNRSATVEFDSPPFKCRTISSLQEMLTNSTRPSLDKE